MSRFWVSVIATLGGVLVVAMGVHAVATFSLYSFLYGLLCGAMIHTWWTLRRTSEDVERTRDVDGLFLMALFFAAQVARPAIAWVESVF